MGMSERGAAAVFVAVSIVGLLGMTAFSFDFGRVYVERRELQVGAEAGALAIARDCAQGACPADVTAEAEIYADANARDGAAWVQSVILDVSAQSVEVITGNEDPDGNRNFDMTFGGVVGVDTYTVGARASAVWGPPGTLSAMPLIYSECEWQSFGEPGFVDENPLGFLHRSSAVRDGQLPPAAGYAYESEYVTIYFHGTQGDCHYGPSGQDLSGGFGWLQTGVNLNQLCEIEVSMGNWQAIDPGSSPSNGCDPVDFTNLLGTVQLIPYFDDYQGGGNNAEYHISGFGAFYITGYYFSGQFKEPSLIDNQFPCNGDDRCVQGYFIGDWVASGGGGVGGGNDHGLNIVGLSG
jgi:Flp pilus assembly protein TadG